MADVVMWVGEVEVDEGVAVDELERLANAGASDRVIIERIGWRLDLPESWLSVSRFGTPVAPGLALEVVDPR